MSPKRIQILKLTLLLVVGSSGQNVDYEDVTERLGLLGPSLGLHPTGGVLADMKNDTKPSESSELSESSEPAPLLALLDPFATTQQCCCFSISESCPSLFGVSEDLLSLGVIETTTPVPTLTTSMNLNQGLTFSARIDSFELINESDCPEKMKSCCYDKEIQLDEFNIQCDAPGSEFLSTDQKDVEDDQCEILKDTRCGIRKSDEGPGEFPWSCLLLTQENGFVGNCALVPGVGDEILVLSAAHKLNKIKDVRRLKVRLGEYDASGFKLPETKKFKEVNVSRIVTHPQFSSQRLDFDAALLILEENVQTSEFINSACLPTCQDHSSDKCWLSGWSVDRNTHVFQPVISKQKMSLVEGNVCQQELRGELANRNSKLGDTFQLSESELCARGEGTCNDIDGGASLVCQSETGRWTLVGLATWDLGCNVPRVFLNVSNIETWIDNILLKVNF